MWKVISADAKRTGGCILQICIRSTVKKLKYNIFQKKKVGESLWKIMISADVKANVKQKEIKELVAVS